ncbi:PilZ domain-containing protein [Ruegeria marisrubri]|uniref:PilZ domain-containing protein n=1 Tax=Ruegeria marisrubri TaxID=1685379 RepID=UPI001CD5F83B|nr:PilZ domain-containing protein [Ruegeria marisrubri]MCA0908532.1 PilZ domain-containing protein [Ruegeria marisrubri]
MSGLHTALGATLFNLLTAVSSLAEHDPAIICARIAELESLAKQVSATGRSNDPEATLDKLVRFHAEIEAFEELATIPTIQRAKVELANLLSDLAGPSGAAIASNTAMSRRVDIALLAHGEFLGFVRKVLECDAAAIRLPARGSEVLSKVRSQSPPPLKPAAPQREHWPITGNLFLLALLLLSLLIVLRNPEQNRRSVRHYCHIPAVMRNSSRCTKTHIVDISEGGMRVEAPQEADLREDVKLFFCGYVSRGRIVWRNKYFAGVQLDEAISDGMIHEVVAAESSASLGAAVQRRALPCHSPDCHRRCPKHRPTALTQNQKPPPP